MKLFTSKDLTALPKDYRGKLMNSIYGCKPALLIGTKNKDGNSNLALFSQVFHVGANPPLIGMIIRPDTVQRDTLTNLRENGYFTINHIRQEMLPKAHLAGCRFPEGISEFSFCGLSEEYTQHPAPYVKEAKIKAGGKIIREMPIEENGTFFILCEILEVAAEEDTLQPNGHLDVSAAGSVAVTGLHSYEAPTHVLDLSDFDCRQEVTKLLEKNNLST